MNSDTHYPTTERHIDAWKTSGSSPPAASSSAAAGHASNQDAEHDVPVLSTPTWMTLAEVAEVLRVSPRTVMRWAEAGELPVLNLPTGRKRISHQHFEAWITNRTTHPDKAA